MSSTASIETTTSTSHILDNPAWAALTGPHAHFAERVGRAARYPADVAGFHAITDNDDPRAWADLAALVGPGGAASVRGVDEAPDGWEIVRSGQGVQLVDTGLRAEPDPEAVLLGAADVPDILDLVARTEPGPYLPPHRRTGHLPRHPPRRPPHRPGRGTPHPPGWTEISAVCTDPDHRGRGLATRLVRAVAAGIKERGDHPFLHAAANNTDAIRLYESIGFTLRARTLFSLIRRTGRTVATEPRESAADPEETA